MGENAARSQSPSRNCPTEIKAKMPNSDRKPYSLLKCDLLAMIHARTDGKHMIKLT